MDANYYIRNNPFKKQEVTPVSRIKQALGVLLVLGLLVVWSVQGSPAVDVRESAMEARGE